MNLTRFYSVRRFGLRTMFLENRYTATYFRLVQKARCRKLDGYSERHHVIPKSVGGKDVVENIVRLTAREHYIAHLLLCKMTSGELLRKMAFAFSRMNSASKTHQRDCLPSRWYEYGRKLLAQVQRNRIVSPETRKLIGKIASTRSPASIKKMSAAKSKPCTIDGTTIYPSKKQLGLTLGWGKTGTLSESFRYL